MKTISLGSVRVLLVTAILPVAVCAAESPSLLLEKAIHAEEIERNLDSAVAIYEQIASEAAANRAVVAQAQYRLALCYQKQGKKEQAIRVLNEIVQHPSADVAVTGKARQLLADLGMTSPEAVSIRRIPLSGNAGRIVAISSDGRLAAFQPHASHELFVQDLVTGKAQLVDKDADMQGHSPPARFSPDGQWIAYDYQEAGIHIAKVDGSGVRKLFPAHRGDGNKHWNELAGWSADGGQVIMAQWNYTRSCRVAVSLDVNTAQVTEFGATPTHQSIAQWHISADGGYVARCSNEYPRTISVFDFKSGREEMVLGRDARHVIGWAGDSAKLVYAKDGDRRVEIYAMEIKDGKPIGVPKPVYADGTGLLSSRRSAPLGVTRDGRIFYAIQRPKPQPAELWAMDGFLPNQPAKLDDLDIQSDIPLEEIIGKNNSITDRTLGFAAIVPTGLSVNSAVRRGDGSVLLNLKCSAATGASVVVIYRATLPWKGEGSEQQDGVLGPRPPASTEIVAWLKGLAERMALNKAKTRTGYTNDHASFRSHVIGGHPALSWTGQFDRDERKRFERHTMIYGGATWALVQLYGDATDMDAASATIDRFVETVRFP
jgi:hypothetical protein